MTARSLALVVLVAALTTCADSGPHAPTAIDGVTLLTHKGSDDGAYPSGLGKGQLVVRDGCVGMRPKAGGSVVFILWAPGFGIRRRDGRNEVVDPEGNLVAAIGDPITLGGGLIGLDTADQLVNGSIPTPCRDHGVEPYFLASPDVRPFEGG
jgi:hypothetical protein